MTEHPHVVEAAETERVEAAILALLLTHDRPWRVSELQRALPRSPGTGAVTPTLLRVSVETLGADGLVADWHRPWRHDRATTPQDRRFVRATRAAVRAAELLAARGE